MDLRPRSASRAVRDVPDVRLHAGLDGLVVRRPWGEPEVLLAPGTPVQARWQERGEVLSAPRTRLSLPPVDDGARLLLVPADGHPVALYEADWTDGGPVALDGPPAWARDLAGALGSGLDGPPAEGAVRRVHPDPLLRQRRGLQLAYGLVSTGLLTYGVLLSVLLAPLPDSAAHAASAVVALTSLPVALLGLVAVGVLWLRGSRRVRAPLPRVTAELGPLGRPPTRHAAQRLRLGARPRELLVRDERGAETALDTRGTTWSRSPDDLLLRAADGFPLRRLPLAVWAPDDPALVRLLDLLQAAGVTAGPPSPGSAPSRRDTVVPAPVPPSDTEVPGLPASGWPRLGVAVNVLDGLLLLGSDRAALQLAGTAQASAALVTVLVAAVTHRYRTRPLRDGIMSGS